MADAVVPDAAAPDAAVADAAADAAAADAAIDDAAVDDAAVADAEADAGPGPVMDPRGSSRGNVERLYTAAGDGTWRPTRWVRGAGDRELMLDVGASLEVRIESAYGEGARFSPDEIERFAADAVRRGFGDEVLDELRASMAAFA
jgi:hypothetical protein